MYLCLSELEFFPKLTRWGFYYLYGNLSQDVFITGKGQTPYAGGRTALSSTERSLPSREADGGAERLPQPHPQAGTFRKLLPVGQFKPVSWHLESQMLVM